MSTNLQPIPLGLIAIQPYKDFIVENGDPFVYSEGEAAYIYQDDNFLNPPSVFIDGLLLTYVMLEIPTRRYVSFDVENKRILIRGGEIFDGEHVQIFL